MNNCKISEFEGLRYAVSRFFLRISHPLLSILLLFHPASLRMPAVCMEVLHSPSILPYAAAE